MIPQLATWSGVNEVANWPFIDPGVSQFLEVRSPCSCLIDRIPRVGVVEGGSPGVGVAGVDEGGLELEFSLEF